MPIERYFSESDFREAYKRWLEASGALTAPAAGELLWEWILAQHEYRRSGYMLPLPPWPEANAVLTHAVTPEMIAAAWDVWKARHGGKLGPGPAFREAIEAALAVYVAAQKNGRAA